jgi:HPt (histidine-containing phosphotransfer) domain-containing protein
MLEKIKSFLVLPPTVSDVEQKYVDRINKIVVIFFALHVPVFMGVAALCGTGVLKAFLLTSACLVGPVLAWKGLPSRKAALVNGFAAMCFGGLLVHFGQGPMQIEMHFYFFVLLGLLAVYGNPMVIVVAAVTVATHHLLIYFLLPSSVFNYEASIWVVLVHALFVVLQSPAAAWIARSFFDNVIGLELIVQARTQALDQRNEDMRLILDNCGQGFVTLDAQGNMSAERSPAVDAWMGHAPAGTPFSALLAEHNPDAGAWFELAWESIMDGFMLLELCISQLPSKVQLGERAVQITYTPLLDDKEQLTGMLVVLTDVTAAMAQAAAEESQLELMAVFGHLVNDRSGFLSFVEEADLIMGRIEDPNCNLVELQRQVHTLKGSGSLFGLSKLTAKCHEAETQMIEDGTLSPAARKGIVESWASFQQDLQQLMAQSNTSAVELSQSEYSDTLKAAEQGVPHQELVQRMQSWLLEPTDRRLERLAQQAQRISGRLGKDLEVHFEGNGLRLEPHAWRSFWNPMVHALRNAADHGTDQSGVLRLVTALEGSSFVLSLSDNGPGVNWEQVRQKAMEMGLPSETQADLQEALFADGLSTREFATETSGRGVGMSSLKEATVSLGGRIEIESVPQQGTTMRFIFPHTAMHGQGADRAAA